MSSIWILYALLGAFFAACVQVLSKPALKIFDEATVNATRAIVMMLFFSGLIFFHTVIRDDHKFLQVKEDGLSPGTGMILMLAGGLAASLSWYFGYKAVSLADVSKTYPLDKLSVAIGVVLAALFLKERPTLVNWAGIGVMIVGALLVTYKAKSGS